MVLEEIYSSSSDVYLPRKIFEPITKGSTRHLQAAAKSSTWNGSVREQDEVWVILEKAKKQEVESPALKFIGDFRVNPGFSVVLSLERQIDDVVNFRTNPIEFTVFSIDSTFNIFNDSISLTFTTYRNNKFENPSTKQDQYF